MYGLTLTSAAAEEPVTTAEAKSWLRVDHSSDDTLVAALVAAARGLCERITGRAFVTQTWRLTLDQFPFGWAGWGFLGQGTPPAEFPGRGAIRVPKAPLQSVSSIQYYDLSDTLQTLASTTYDVDAAHDPGRITLAFGQVWPVTRPKPGAVRITFVAGYGAASAVPQEIKHAVMLTVARWYENRGEDAAAMNDLPAGAKALLAGTWNGEMEYGNP